MLLVLMLHTTAKCFLFMLVFFLKFVLQIKYFGFLP